MAETNNVVLRVLLNDAELCRITSNELPVEKTLSNQVSRETAFVLEDSRGKRFVHDLAHEESWIHFSIRVHQHLACQADCLVSDSQQVSNEDFRVGKARGIRFSPIYLPGCKADATDLKGRGLFYRGLHFSGTITPSNVSLSCICDSCERSFRLQSFHAGFSQCGYFYSDSGMNTLIVDDSVPGCPPASGKPDLRALTELEARLPLAARDRTRFRYNNPLRCPHCRTPYIDFERHPTQREHEYYGNYFYGDKPQRFQDQ